MTTKLTCILDDCPMTMESVDYRKCPPCDHFLPSTGVGTVVCSHAEALHNPRPERMDAIRDSVGVAHITQADPPTRES